MHAIAIVLCAAMTGCVARAPGDPSRGAAVRVVQGVEAGLAVGDFGPAHEALDYAYRLDEVLGDVWRAGSDKDRAGLEGLAREMFEDTTLKYWPTCCASSNPVARIDRVDGEHVWVRSAVAEEPTGFRWMYRLTRRGDKWRITQREFQDNRALRSNSTQFWPMAMQKISRQYGRAPTLKELTANLPATMGTIRTRVFQVP